MRKIKQLFLVLAMSFVSAGMVACSCGKDNGKAPAFVFAEEVPTEMGITEQVYFRNYLEENDDAEYKLYVSYYDKINDVQVTDKPLSSMIFILEQETEYTFKIERILNGKSTYLTCTINVLPETPRFQESGRIPTASKGSTKTFEEIFTASQYVVTPGNLESQLQFLSYDFTSVVEGVEDQTDVAISETATDFTFTNEGVYVFDVKAENAKGSAQTTITVNAFNATNAEAKVEMSYDPFSKTLSWEAIDGATAYRVWVDDNDYVDVLNATFSFADEAVYPDGEYTVKVVPVFDGVIYKGAAVTEPLSVGRVYTPLALTKEMDIVSWPTRYFVETYTVIENGQEYTYDADTRSHALQGTYATDTDVTVQVYGTFDNGSVTETAEIKVVTGELGTTTLKQIQAAAGVASGVEWVAFDMEERSDVWFLSEFVGKNAPNYGIQVLNLTSVWDGSHTIKRDAEGNKLGVEYTPGGMLLCNTGEKSWKDLWLYRGYNTNASGDGRGSVGDGVNMGMYNYKDNVRYIQIIGYEIISESMTNNARLTAYLFTVDEGGTLTLVNKAVGEATYATHVLGGTYATYYGNIAVGVDMQGPESVTFSYAKPAKTLNSLLYNITASYQYREQLITLCEASQPSAENNFVPTRVIGEVFNDGREVDDGDDEPKVLKLSAEATLSSIDADANGNVASLENKKIAFDGFDGETWFITQFTGKNAPNYGVRSYDFSAWQTTDSSAANYTGGANSGALITNSARQNQRSMRMYYNSNTFTDCRGSIDGSWDNGPGLEYYKDGQEYIQIIGYSKNTTTDGAADAKIYIFQVTDGKLTLVFEGTATGKNCWNGPKGSTAVLYGNIHTYTSAGADISAGGDSVTFSYEAPQTTLAALINGLSEDYAFKADLKTMLNIQDQDDGNDEQKVLKLSAEATLSSIDADANGNVASVENITFDGFDGETWFITQFTGKNAPNYAVRSYDFSAWQTTDSSAANYTGGANSGCLITNSARQNQRSMRMYYNSNTFTDCRGSIDGSWDNGPGLEYYKDGQEYIQIIGYSQNAATDTSADVKIYIFQVTGEKLRLVFEDTATGKNCWNGPKGSTAVLYGNIHTYTSAGADISAGGDSVTFSYEAPQTTLAALINGLADNYAFKADLKTALSIA